MSSWLTPETIVKLGTSAISLLGEGSTTSRSQTNDVRQVDNGIYPTGPFERQQLSDAYLNTVEDMYNGYDPSGASYMGPGGTASAGYASEIDLGDISFAPEPTTGLRENFYNRIASGARASGNNDLATLQASLARQGVSINSPMGMYMAQQIRSRMGQSANEGFTNFYDKFVSDALGRRAGAQYKNADVRMGNARNSTDASISNSAVNAQSFASGQAVAGDRLGQLMKALQWGQEPVDHMQNVNGGSNTVDSGEPGSAARTAGAVAPWRDQTQNTQVKSQTWDPTGPPVELRGA